MGCGTGACRTRLLGVPTKVAPIVAVETDQSLVKDTLEDAIYTALGELAADWVSDEPGGDGEFKPSCSRTAFEDGPPPKLTISEWPTSKENQVRSKRRT